MLDNGPVIAGTDWFDGLQEARFHGLRDQNRPELDQKSSVAEPLEADQAQEFLFVMEVVVPWQALIDLIEPYYPKTSKKGGRPPYHLATMLRAHLLQHWYSHSDSPMEEALIEVPTMRSFAGIEPIGDWIPDETTAAKSMCSKP